MSVWVCCSSYPLAFSTASEIEEEGSTGKGGVKSDAGTGLSTYVPGCGPTWGQSLLIMHPYPASHPTNRQEERRKECQRNQKKEKNIRRPPTFTFPGALPAALLAIQRFDTPVNGCGQLRVLQYLHSEARVGLQRRLVVGVHPQHVLKRVLGCIDQRAQSARE